MTATKANRDTGEALKQLRYLASALKAPVWPIISSCGMPLLSASTPSPGVYTSKSQSQSNQLVDVAGRDAAAAALASSPVAPSAVASETPPMPMTR